MQFTQLTDEKRPENEQASNREPLKFTFLTVTSENLQPLKVLVSKTIPPNVVFSKVQSEKVEPLMEPKFPSS